MKTIKIFIASSKELKDERVLMASLANELSTRLEKVGIQVIAVEWESLDASMNEEHKQEEYNEKLRECDMCMVLYWTKFGMYTKTELDTAYHEKLEGKNPQKVWVYFKEVDDPSNMPTEELKEFRDSFPTKYGHFYTPFANFDTLKAHFLLQFMEYQSQALQGKSIVEVKNGKVTVDGKEYVDLQNVPFAGNNEEYNDLIKDIEELQEDLEDMSPDNPRYARKAEKLLKSKEKLAKMESSLWDTALMITKLCTTKCSERLQRAMDLFNQGDNKGAQAILNEEEIEKDVQHNLNLIKIGEEGKKGLKINLDEYLLKIKSIKSSDADKNASQLIALYHKVIKISEHLYGEFNENTATYYKELADLYSEYGNLDDALKFHAKALDIRKSVLGQDDLSTAESYDNLGGVYQKCGNHQKAFELKNKAYEIREMVCGHIYPDVAYSLSNIAGIYLDIRKCDDALTCAEESMKILNEYYKGNDNTDIAHQLRQLGICYIHLEDYDNALSYEKRALGIYQKLSNKDANLDITNIYSDFGTIYGYKGDYHNALKYHQMALDLFKKIHGKYHPDVSTAYMNVGIDLRKMGKFNEAIDSENTALEITNELFGPNSIQVAKTKKNLAILYHSIKDYDKMIAAYQDIVYIYSNLKGCSHQLLLQAEYDLGWAFSEIGDYRSSKIHLEKGLELLDESSPQALASYFSLLGHANKQLKEYDPAVECFWKAAEYFEDLGDWESCFCNIKEAAEIGDVESCDKLGEMYEFGEGVEVDYPKAIEWYLKSANHGFEDSYNGLAWTYHKMGKYEGALPWAKKAVEVSPEDPDVIDSLATVYQDLGRYNEALEQFELCFKLYKEQEDSEGIQETEAKIAELKELMK